MTNFQIITLLLAPATALLGLATSKPRLFLSIRWHLLALLVLINTAISFWSFGVWQAKGVLLAFVRADATQAATIAINGLDIPLVVHLCFTGYLLCYGIAHLLASKGDKDKGDIKHD